MISYLLQQLLNALLLGSIYALIALGYTMVYGILTMINFAHGDIFMLGAFISFYAVSYFNPPFTVVLLVSILATALLGVLTERLAYRPLRHAPRISVIITALGVGLFLENLTLVFNPYPLHVPALLPDVSWRLGELSISLLQLLIILLSFLLMFALDMLVRKTKFGMAMRAVSYDINIAPLVGVPVDFVISATFALGAGLGGAAGVLYSLAFPVIDPYMGIVVGWKAFISAVIGGIGNIRGAVVGGFFLATVEILVAAFLPSTLRDVIAFGLLLLLLIYRPGGLFNQVQAQKV